MVSSAKICTLLLLLAAQQVMLLVETAAATTSSSSSHGGGGGGCIRRVDEVSSKYGSCHCYRKCSDPEEGWLTTAASQRCFEDCVLRQGCVCPSDGNGEAPPLQGSDDDGSPPATTTTPKVVPAVLPALLDETNVSVTVPRPSKVSRSRTEKEVLVVDTSFAPLALEDVTSLACSFTAHVSPPWRRISDEDPTYRLMPMKDVFRFWSSDAYFILDKQFWIPINKDMEKIGADGDNTIMVWFAPPQFPQFDKTVVDTFKKCRLTIRDVRVEYYRPA